MVKYVYWCAIVIVAIAATEADMFFGEGIIACGALAYAYLVRNSGGLGTAFAGSVGVPLSFNVLDVFFAHMQGEQDQPLLDDPMYPGFVLVMGAIAILGALAGWGYGKLCRRDYLRAHPDKEDI